MPSRPSATRPRARAPPPPRPPPPPPPMVVVAGAGAGEAREEEEGAEMTRMTRRCRGRVVAGPVRPRSPRRPARATLTR